jgi:outer membrane lipoprotein SlyB
MKRHQLLAWAAVAALSVAAQAQDYRYQNPGDPPRQYIQQPPQGQPAPQYQQQPVQQYQQQPAQQYQQQPLQPYQQQPGAICNNCGTVDAVRRLQQPGEASGAGMVAGGLLGGLIGHQVGQGRGNTAATIVGAAGGAYAGHQVEKNTKNVTTYEVTVRMDNGSPRTFNYDVEPGFRAGDRVRFVDGRLSRY